MLIDWFTTAAQIVNFAILVWLLKRFLYKPILNAIDAREKRIASALAQAEEQRKSAENQRLQFEQKSEELASEKVRILKQATQDASEERKRMIAEARVEVAELKSRWQEAMEKDGLRLSEQVAARIQEEIFSISRKVLSDLAGVKLDSCIADRFVQQLSRLGIDEKERLAGSIRSQATPCVTIASAFELSSNNRRLIQEALEQALGWPAPVRFVTVPANTGGIELSTDGYKTSWTIQAYLSSLERDAKAIMIAPEAEHVQAVK